MSRTTRKYKSPVFKELCGLRNRVEKTQKEKGRNRNSKQAKREMRQQMGE